MSTPAPMRTLIPAVLVAILAVGCGHTAADDTPATPTTPELEVLDPVVHDASDIIAALDPAPKPIGDGFYTWTPTAGVVCQVTALTTPAEVEEFTEAGEMVVAANPDRSAGVTIDAEEAATCYRAAKDALEDFPQP